MSERELERRVRALEREVTDLKAQIASFSASGEWRRTVGMFRGDAVFREIVEAGAAIRQAEQDAS